MAHIRLDDNEFELSTGELRIGTDDDAGVRLEGVGEKGNLAIITVDPRGAVTVRRVAAGATVLVNGVALGAEPSPLLHGDRIEVAGRQLRFSDDRKAGSTVLMPALGAPAATSPAPDRGRAGVSGGRLVSLVDGREYEVAATGLRIGRDASCDIVVPGTDVSRHHAQISGGPAGYVVRDLSANGVFVNNARTGDAHPLRRGDVIRVGSEEFRFYADQTRSVAGQATAPEPAPPVPAVRAPLATLEVVNAGTSKGMRYEIRRPLAHVGRGPHNDVVVTDDSVSDSHAKLQRRDSGWFIVDVDSTNGTYVAGQRVRGERALDSSAAVRFGGVKVIFRAAPPEVVEAEGGTRVIVGLKPSDQQRAPVARPVVAARQAEARDSTKTTRGVAALVWVAAAAVVGATILYVIQDR
jgi:pSer/pThr/pTyr-binding forkhead associated (FHA) protein